MSLAVVYSRAQLGVQAPLVTVEVQLSNGLPSLSIVGLAETAVRESKDRVRGAILQSGFEFPARRITINLAPADLPKDGGRFDLPIALGILAASGQLQTDRLDQFEFIGELALSGALRPVCGVLPGILQAADSQRSMICPTASSTEAGLVDANVSLAGHLLNVCAFLNGQGELEIAEPTPTQKQPASSHDMQDVRGQLHAKRALEIAAAGGHNLLFIGPPGTGKTLLASCLPGILPPLSRREALETAAIQSVSGRQPGAGDWYRRPFRAPHHTASAVALVGGGASVMPGEISLAHNGVLFLDELPEFQRSVLDVLRQPLETGHICISRAARQATYPARFQLLAAMNPCKCGQLGDPSGRCRCTPDQIQNYRNRISGPLLDRIDMHIEVPRLSFRELDGPAGESSLDVLERVCAARSLQMQRGGCTNAALHNRQLDTVCHVPEAARTLLENTLVKLHISARACHRILKVARTIADLDTEEQIQTRHLNEAISYRRLDRSAI